MKPTVVLQTDFGNGGGGVMAGVIRSVDPEVPVYDFDHYIEAFNTIAASASLSGAVKKTYLKMFKIQLQCYKHKQHPAIVKKS